MELLRARHIVIETQGHGRGGRGGRYALKRNPCARLSRFVFCAALLVGGVMFSGGALAQGVSGSVRDTATRAAVAGAVVTALDSLQHPMLSVLTNEAGRFTLLGSTKAARLRIVRLGYRPVIVERPEGRDPAVPFEVWMSRVPTLLSGVRVTEQSICPSGESRGVALALWEQARAGLLATVIAREQAPARATTWNYMRALSLGDDRVIQQRRTVATGRTTRPFLSADSPERLAAAGFIQEESDGRVYKAPDADVLMDESFGTTHCFQIRERDTAHPDAVGLEFVPAPGRDSLVDVSGVLWMRLGKPELQSLEFRFTGLEPSAVKAGSGGTLRFRTVSNGVAFIERWVMRIPVLEEERRPTSARMGAFKGERDVSASAQARRFATNRRVVQISEHGGAVLRAVWNDTLVWRNALPMLTGSVTEVGTERPLRGAVVTLSGTEDSAVSDSSGKFAMSPILPGRYTVNVADTAFAAVARARTVSQSITIGEEGTTELALHLPPRSTTLERLCDGQRLPEQSAIIFGSLGGAFGTDTSRFVVTADWVRSFVHALVGAPTIALRSDQRVEVSGDGRFRICGVPPVTRVHIALFKDGRQVSDSVLTAPANAEAMSLQWIVPHVAKRRDVAATGSFHGMVTGAGDGRPLVDADLWIPAIDFHIKTDSAGRFRADDIAAGETLLQIRRLGYRVWRDTLSIVPDAVITRDFALSATAAELDTVRTVSSQVKYSSARLRGFENRRAAGSGYFIPESDLRKEDDRTLSSVVASRTSGLTVISSGSGAAYLVSSRVMCAGRAFGGCSHPSCFVTLYLDGVMVYSAVKNAGAPAPDMSRYHVSDLAGVEFYPSGGGGPAEFNITDSGCGTLLLWTRER